MVYFLTENWLSFDLSFVKHVFRVNLMFHFVNEKLKYMMKLFYHKTCINSKCMNRTAYQSFFANNCCEDYRETTQTSTAKCACVTLNLCIFFF